MLYLALYIIKGCCLWCLPLNLKYGNRDRIEIHKNKHKLFLIRARVSVVVLLFIDVTATRPLRGSLVSAELMAFVLDMLELVVAGST